MEKGKWIVGVSGGCDSMALLDILYNQGHELYVAHVNYQKRDTAARDMKIVKDYCDARKIECLIKINDEEAIGNFQAYARKLRYAFFRECAEKYGCEGVMIAHHQDDLLETFILQKRRQSVPIHYGLRGEVEIDGLLIKRPLLAMSKLDCQHYCEEKTIAYGEDESNLTDVYERNKVRHEIVEKLSDEEKAAYLLEIDAMNIQKVVDEENCETLAKSYGAVLPIASFVKEGKQKQRIILRKWLEINHGGVHYTGKFIENALKCLYKQGNWFITLDENWKMQRSYDELMCVKNSEGYAYTFDKLETFECPYFKISNEGKTTESVTLSDDDFPITIRNVKKGDAIEMRFGIKKVNRWFIDRKISHNEREFWPVLVNRVGNVILVPQIGCDIEHFSNKPNCFVIK